MSLTGSSRCVFSGWYSGKRAFIPEKLESLLNIHNVSNKPLKKHKLSMLNACRNSRKCYMTCKSLHILSIPKSPKEPCTVLRESRGHVTALLLCLCFPVWGKSCFGLLQYCLPCTRPSDMIFPCNTASPEKVQELCFALGCRCGYALTHVECP